MTSRQLIIYLGNSHSDFFSWTCVYRILHELFLLSQSSWSFLFISRNGNFTLPSSLQRVYDFLPTWCFASPLNTPLAKEKSRANKSKTLSLELHVATTYWSWPKIQNHTLLQLWKIGPGTSTKGHKRVNFSRLKLTQVVYFYGRALQFAFLKPYLTSPSIKHIR